MNKESVSFDSMKLETMLFEVQQAQEDLLHLLVQVDYTVEQRGFFVGLIRNLSTLEESINQVENNKYVSRSQLKRQFNNIYVKYTNNFDSLVTFYEKNNHAK